MNESKEKFTAISKTYNLFNKIEEQRKNILNKDIQHVEKEIGGFDS